MIDNQNDSLDQVVQDRVGGEVDQVASIDEGDQFYALRQYEIVEFLYLFMDALAAPAPHRVPFCSSDDA